MNGRVPDIIEPGLAVLFCGINPSLYSAAVGHHFARPGNRFWKALHGAGFTPRLLSPWEDGLLPEYGCGITNMVARATAAADELAPEEYVEGRKTLLRRVRRCRPGILAVLGAGAFRAGFGRPRAPLGPQEDVIGETRVWVLPNPSGLNAGYPLPELVRLFSELKAAADRHPLQNRRSLRIL